MKLLTIALPVVAALSMAVAFEIPFVVPRGSLTSSVFVPSNGSILSRNLGDGETTVVSEETTDPDFSDSDSEFPDTSDPEYPDTSDPEFPDTTTTEETNTEETTTTKEETTTTTTDGPTTTTDSPDESEPTDEEEFTGREEFDELSLGYNEDDKVVTFEYVLKDSGIPLNLTYSGDQVQQDGDVVTYGSDCEEAPDDLMLPVFIEFMDGEVLWPGEEVESANFTWSDTCGEEGGRQLQLFLRGGRRLGDSGRTKGYIVRQGEKSSSDSSSSSSSDSRMVM